MSSVRKTGGSAQPNAPERRVLACATCGGAIEPGTGKRVQVYCGEACRSKMRRRQAAAERPAASGRRGGKTITPKNGRLGTTARTTDMQVRGGAEEGVSAKTVAIPVADAADRDPRFSGADTGESMASDTDTAARDGRFKLREALRSVSALDRLKACGRRVLAGGVAPVIRNGRAGFAGLVTCGSVHVCPCCSTSIRRVRQDELDQVGRFWECQSCGLVMMTLTMRHYEKQLLAVLAEQQRVAWRHGFGQNAGRRWRDAKKEFGVRGFVRAWEVTHGSNGWHCHYHVLLFLARPLAAGRVEQLQHLAFEVWSAALEKAGAYLPVERDEKGNPVGVRIDAPDRGESGKLARYLMKGQDGKTKWGIAAELTRQDVKQGQGGHRTPFEIAMAAIRDGADPRDVALWREFEQTATGIRSLYWSNGLRKLLAEMGFELDDRQDGQVAADDAAAGDRLALIPAVTWYRHVIRHDGRALALLRAAERLGAAGIRTLIESWGLVWGVDVLEAEDEGGPDADGVIGTMKTAELVSSLPTAAELLRQIGRADQVDRAEFWRRSFDQLGVEDASKRRAAEPDTAAMVRRQLVQARRADAAARQDREVAAARGEQEIYREQFLAARRDVVRQRPDDVQESLERVRARG